VNLVVDQVVKLEHVHHTHRHVVVKRVAVFPSNRVVCPWRQLGQRQAARMSTSLAPSNTGWPGAALPHTLSKAAQAILVEAIDELLVMLLGETSSTCCAELRLSIPSESCPQSVGPAAKPPAEVVSRI